MTTHSAEIRWFFEEPATEAVKNWFQAGQTLEVETRIDDYLLLPECDSTGVKMRGGESSSFEIKALVCAPHPLRLENGVNGHTDQWVRWSFNDPGLEKLESAITRREQWVTVKKARLLRKFSADAGDLVEVNAQEKPKNGCGVELTSIQAAANEAEWFSLAFEAFGSPSEVAKTLGDTLRFFFDHNELPSELKLSGRNSWNYPMWLATLTAPRLLDQEERI